MQAPRRFQVTRVDFESIRKQFLDVYTSVRDLSDDDILRSSGWDFGASYEGLASLGALLVTEQLAYEILANPRFLQTARRLGHIVNLVEQRRELDFAELVCASVSPLECLKSLSSYPTYSKEIESEVGASALRSVGYGSVPGKRPCPF